MPETGSTSGGWMDILKMLAPWLAGGAAGLAIDNNNSRNYVEPTAAANRAGQMTSSANDVLQGILAGTGQVNTNLAASRTAVSSMPGMTASGRTNPAVNDRILQAALGNFGSPQNDNTALRGYATTSLANRFAVRPPIARR